MLEAAVVAARLAGQRAMEELRYVKKDIKNGDEIVTQADPFFRIVPRGGEPIWWVIDPIDGTNNFANGLLCFSVSIAAMVEGKPIVGVIFDPTTDSMYTAAQDMDAQLNGSRISVSENDVGPFASFGVDSHLAPSTNKGMQTMAP
jgi:fructose-1,6-bisphosphatase/inositol monophosphatase family enzyme